MLVIIIKVAKSPISISNVKYYYYCYYFQLVLTIAAYFYLSIRHVLPLSTKQLCLIHICAYYFSYCQYQLNKSQAASKIYSQVSNVISVFSIVSPVVSSFVNSIIVHKIAINIFPLSISHLYQHFLPLSFNNNV